jgi:hypothetical protein
MKEMRIKNVWVQTGFYRKSFGLGVFISSIQCSLDLGIFFIQIELPARPSRRLKKYEKQSKNG